MGRQNQRAYRGRQRGSVALLAICVLFVLLILVSVSLDSAVNARLSSTWQDRHAQLRLLAESGLEYGYWRRVWANAPLPYSENNRALGAGRFSVTVTDNGAQITNTIRVSSTATLSGRTLTLVRVYPLPSTTTAGLPNYPNGFSDTTQIQRNGSAISVGTTLRLAADGQRNQAGSFFYRQRVPVDRFTTSFTFHLTSPSRQWADGITFCIQNAGLTALGRHGGHLGYAGMNNSVAIKFDIWQNVLEGISSMGLYTGGANPHHGSITLLPNVNLRSGNVMQVNMSYNGTTLTITIRDTITGLSATQNYSIHIPTAVGGSQAYVGFTGATGGSTANHDILTWTYTSP
jgi:hypothetical protein